MKMYIDGSWADSAKTVPVISPFSGEQVDTVPDASPEQVEATLAAAVLFMICTSWSAKTTSR